MYTFKDKQKTLFKRKAILKNNITNPEFIFKNKLDILNLKYIFQKAFIKGNNYIITDFYLPRLYKLCIEIDGGYHLTQEQKIRDKNKDNYITSRGFKILRLTNEEAVNISLKDLLQLI